MKAQRGRPPKMKEASELVAFRLPSSLLRRLEQFARDRMRFRGGAASRADALRHLLELGFQYDQRQSDDVKTTFQELTKVLGGPGRRAPRGR